MATAAGILIRNLKIEHDATYQLIQDVYNTTLPEPSSPKIILDPYQCNPLAALICLHTERGGRARSPWPPTSPQSLNLPTSFCSTTVITAATTPRCSFLRQKITRNVRAIGLIPVP